MTATEDSVILNGRDADMDGIQAVYAHHMCHGLVS